MHARLQTSVMSTMTCDGKSWVRRPPKPYWVAACSAGGGASVVASDFMCLLLYREQISQVRDDVIGIGLGHGGPDGQRHDPRGQARGDLELRGIDVPIVGHEVQGQVVDGGAHVAAAQLEEEVVAGAPELLGVPRDDEEVAGVARIGGARLHAL